jgi:hypothetical protein
MADQRTAVNLFEGERPQGKDLPLTQPQAGNHAHAQLVPYVPAHVARRLVQDLRAGSPSGRRPVTRVIGNGLLGLEHEPRLTEVDHRSARLRVFSRRLCAVDIMFP